MRRGPAHWVRAAVAMFAVGWGANQFTSLLLAYRAERNLSAAVTDGAFGAYALGLIPALLVGGPLSDRLGRRPLARFAVLLSLVATGVLILGTDGTGWLFAGRLLAGIASGAIFAPGTTWVKELSTAPFTTSEDADAGARRAAISLSAGFGLGPLVAGIVAQYAPHPLVVPYVAHVVVVVIAAPLVWFVPETVARRPEDASVRSRLRVRSASAPRFRRVVAPAAPWVFGAASISMTIGPAQVVEHTGSARIAFAAAIAGLTLTSGVLVQPLARRLDRPGDPRAMITGLAAVVAGCLVQAATAATGAPALAVVAAVVLGAAYGFLLIAGLLETQRIAEPTELGGLTSYYYALTYVGFAAPLALAELNRLASYPVLLCGAAVIATATLFAIMNGTKVPQKW